MMCVEKRVLVKRMFTNRLKLICHCDPSQKDSLWIRNSKSLVTKKYLGAAVNKEGYSDSVLEHERTHQY